MSPRPPLPESRFHWTALDREILEHCRDDIDLWAKGYFDRQFFPWQQYFYHAPQKHKLLVAAIRTGKSHLAGGGFMHYAQYHPYSRLLNTSISSEQAKIVYQKCLEYCEAPRFRHWVEHVQSSPYPLIRLVNGSELWFRSIGYEAELLRGFEFDLINVDEAAYVMHEVAIKTLRGRLLGVNPHTGVPRAGIMWMTTSPKGQGWLAELWKKGDPSFSMAQPHKYLSLRATIWDNPLLNQEDIEELMAEYTEAMIRQELYGEFLSALNTVFPYQLVMAGCDDTQREVRLLYDQIRIFQATMQTPRSLRVDAGLSEDILHYECEPQAGHRYVSSWDLGKKATAKGRNAMVGLVLDITHEPWSMVAYRYAEQMGYVEAKSEIERWHEKYSYNMATCSTVIDSTGKGDVLLEFMERERTVDDLEGIVYSGANKPNLIHAGKLIVERSLVRYPFIRRMVDQLTNYDLFDKDIPQDIVMAFCQGCYRAREMTRMSDRPPLQQSLNRRIQMQYAARSPLIRAQNLRYVQTRRLARIVRKGARTRL